MKKRVTYRPSKSQAVFGGVVGGIFVLIGIFVAIPSFGLFGIFWTLIAVGITASSLYHAFGKRYTGPEIHIEEEPDGGDAAERLRQLEDLRRQGLITEEEFAAKRQEILNTL